MVSSIALNIPAAGLGSRPASIVSTSTLDEGGFNEPSPEIKAKLKPHEDNIFNFGPKIPNQQRSIDSDVLYHATAPTDSIPSEIEQTKVAVKSESASDIVNSESSVTGDSGRCTMNESEPFLVLRSHINEHEGTARTESPKSEASLLDLQDVEYADASDEEAVPVNVSKVSEAEAMTQAEAENLLSSRYHNSSASLSQMALVAFSLLIVYNRF